jgi:UDP-glucuronate 4-epimerase
MRILITGAAGFIGYHLSVRLIELGFETFGLDNVNDYYDVNLKLARLNNLGIAQKNIIDHRFIRSSIYQNFEFIKADISNHDFVVEMMLHYKFDVVVNLAAQAGVRYSLENPKVYISSNVNGFLSILEGCRHSEVKHLIYASTSSVYGLNDRYPLSERTAADHPITLYAASKKSNEMMAHSYSHLFDLPTTGLRFFTVYGPWGRPDMALFLFTKAILNSEPVNLFNYGKMVRDFTYVDDVVESIYRLLDVPPMVPNEFGNFQVDSSNSTAPYRILNIGNSEPVEIRAYVTEIERVSGLSANLNLMPMQDGDVVLTHSDTSKLNDLIHFTPRTSISKGVELFYNWYVKYYNIRSVN